MGGTNENDIRRFNNREIGIIAQFYPYIYTVDGGFTWYRWSPSKIWESKLDMPRISEARLDTDGNGLLVFSNVSTKRYTFKTTDKGITWKLEKIEEE